MQAISVGNFRLAENSDQSDKSAMPTVDQIRDRIRKAMERVPEGPVTVAIDLGFERNHIRDFLDGKKRSLKTEVMMAIADRYAIPFKDLIITKQKPADRLRA